MKIGSLFSGIGGLELGLEIAGVGETVWQVEKDKYCQQVLQKHWPDVTIYDNIETIDWDTVEPVEVVCGGFPCQDISIAGRGDGLEGDKSGLWWEFARCIRHLRPRYVVVENVPALTFRGMGDVLGELASLGYDCEWDCIPAAAVGANHQRDRIFIVAYPRGARRREDTGSTFGSEKELEGWSEEHDHQFERYGASSRTGNVAHSDSKIRCSEGCDTGEIQESRQVERSRRRSSISWDNWTVEPDVGRVAYGVPKRVDRLRALGNAVVPQVAAVVGYKILELDETKIFD